MSASEPVSLDLKIKSTLSFTVQFEKIRASPEAATTGAGGSWSDDRPRDLTQF